MSLISYFYRGDDVMQKPKISFNTIKNNKSLDKFLRENNKKE